MERSTQSPRGNNIHDRYNLVTGTRKKNSGEVGSVITALLLVGALGTSVLYPAFKKTERATKALDSTEISEEQRRVLDDYERVMSELNLQIKELSEGEFSIEDEPPTVHGMYIPLNRKTNK